MTGWTGYSEYTVGSAPTAWQTSPSGDATIEVKADAALIGGQWLNTRGGGGTTPKVAAWDEPGTPADVEVLVKLRENGCGAAVRIGDENNNYHVYLPVGFTPRLRKRVGSSYTQLANLGGNDVAADTWYWARFRCIGTQLQARVWIDGDPEPTTWQADVADSDLASGYVGVFTHDDLADAGADYFSYGLDGDSAPESGQQAQDTGAETLLDKDAVSEQRARDTGGELLLEGDQVSEQRDRDSGSEVLLQGDQTSVQRDRDSGAEVLFDVSTAITVAVSQVVETETAQPVTIPKSVVVGQVVETEAAQPVTIPKAVTVGKVVESESAQPASASKTVQVGLVTEAETPRPVTVSGQTKVSVGQVVETESLFSVGVDRTVAVGQVTESESAQAVSITRSVTVSQVVETETATAVTTTRSVPVGLVTETETPLAIQSVPIFVAVGQVVESETPLRVTIPKFIGVGQVTETETPLPVTGVFTGIVAISGTGTVTVAGSSLVDTEATILIDDVEMHGKALVTVAVVDPPPTIAEVALRQKSFVMPKPTLDEGQPS